MERDFNRYIVVKVAHAKEALTEAEQDTLLRLSLKCMRWRRVEGKAPLKCVVVEHDWPEYEPTWQAIEARVNASDNIEYAYNNGWKNAEAAVHDGYQAFLMKGISPYCQGWNDYMRPLMDNL